MQSVYPSGKAYGGPGRLGFDQRAHLTENSPLATESNRAKLLAQWGPRWDMSKHVLVEKSPPNLLKTRLLQALFPEAAFVVIIRHPIAVTLATRRLWGGSIESLVEHWLICHETFMADAPFVRRLIAVRYEDLVADSELIGEVQAALGLRPPSDVDYFASGLNEAYLEQWRGEHSASELSVDVEQRVRRFGYSIGDAPKSDVRPAADFESLLAGWRQ